MVPVRHRMLVQEHRFMADQARHQPIARRLPQREQARQAMALLEQRAVITIVRLLRLQQTMAIGVGLAC
jgi:hypothetical protein